MTLQCQQPTHSHILMLGAAAAAGQQIRISNENSLSVLTQAIVIRFIIPVCSKHMYKMKMIIVTLFIKSRVP